MRPCRRRAPPSSGQNWCGARRRWGCAWCGAVARRRTCAVRGRRWATRLVHWSNCSGRTATARRCPVASPTRSWASRRRYRPPMRAWRGSCGGCWAVIGRRATRGRPPRTSGRRGSARGRQRWARRPRRSRTGTIRPVPPRSRRQRGRRRANSGAGWCSRGSWPREGATDGPLPGTGRRVAVPRWAPVRRPQRPSGRKRLPAVSHGAPGRDSVAPSGRSGRGPARPAGDCRGGRHRGRLQGLAAARSVPGPAGSRYGSAVPAAAGRLHRPSARWPLDFAAGRAALWLAEADLRAYLRGEPVRAVEGDTLFCRESRLGIGINDARRTSEEGALYEADFIRPRTDVGLLAEVQGYTGWPPRGLLRLGGEARGASFEQVSALRWPAPPDPLPARFKLYFATPTFFRDGWRPLGEDWGAYFDGGVELVAAAVGRYESVGGFDLARASHKPARRYVPAGSVYYFESGGAARLRPGLVQQAVTDWGAAIGFGQILVEEWDRV